MRHWCVPVSPVQGVRGQHSWDPTANIPLHPSMPSIPLPASPCIPLSAPLGSQCQHPPASRSQHPWDPNASIPLHPWDPTSNIPLHPSPSIPGIPLPTPPCILVPASLDPTFSIPQHPCIPGIPPPTSPCIPVLASPGSHCQHPPASLSPYSDPISPPATPVPPTIPPRPPPRGPSLLIDSSPSQWPLVAAGEGGGPEATRGAAAAGAEPAAGPRPLRYRQRLRAPPGPASRLLPGVAAQVRAVGAGAAPPGPAPGAAVGAGAGSCSRSRFQRVSVPAVRSGASIPVPPTHPRAPSRLAGCQSRGAAGPRGAALGGTPVVMPLCPVLGSIGALGWPSGCCSLPWHGWVLQSRAVEQGMLLWSPPGHFELHQELHPPARAAAGDAGGLGSWQVCPCRVPGVVCNQRQQFRTSPWCWGG